jgi:UDP-glucose 4-epimerase
MVLPRFVRWAIRNEPIMVYGDGEQQRCFCNVHDVVRAIADLGDTPRAVGEVYNIGSSEEVTIMELAERVRARAGSASDIRKIPYEQAYETGFEDFRRRVPNAAKIRAVTEWEPTIALDDTIDQIIAYQREQIDHG